MANVAKFVGGWWLPESDEQLIKDTGNIAFKRPIRDGRHAWQYPKITSAIVKTKARRTAIDVGAHVGWWTYWLARKFEHVHAFEPIIGNYTLLCRNVPHGNVTFYCRALGDEKGSAMMSVPDKTTRAHISPKGDRSVMLEMLDDFHFADVDLIKIDVEGFERKVLWGGKRTIKRNKPLIVIEQLGHEARYGEEQDSALALLREWGAIELRTPQKGDYFMGWQ